jgi:hypothetical protein
MSKQSAIDLLRNGTPFDCPAKKENLTEEAQTIAEHYFKIGVIEAMRLALGLSAVDQAYVAGYIECVYDDVKIDYLG